MKGLKSKYESLGNIGGSFTLSNPTEGEIEFLTRHFKKNYSDHKTISISLIKFQSAFNNTILEGADLKEVLDSYYGEVITSKKDLKQNYVDIRTEYFIELTEEVLHIKSFIHDSLKTKSIAYKWLMVTYNKDAKRLFTVMRQLDQLIHEITLHEFVILPVLAAKVSKNPHALDESELLYKALIYFYCNKYGLEYPTTAEDKALVLEIAGVVNNNINRFIQTYGLLGCLETSLEWEAFHLRNEPLVLTDMNLKNVSITASNPSVYCFENPSVFLAFIRTYPSKSAICTGGQVNQTVLKVMDELDKNNIRLLYQGDYDPEGLMIADKLKKRFKKLKLIGYNTELYLKSRSNKILSRTRLNQLKRLNDPMLHKVSELLLEYKVAGYQEYVLEDILLLIE